MATNLSTSFSFPSSTPVSAKLPVTQFDWGTGWGTTYRTVDMIGISNRKTPIGQDELIYFEERPIKTVQNNLDLDNVKAGASGIQYGCKSEMTLVTTDPEKPDYLRESAIVFKTQIRHEYSNLVTPELVAEGLTRHISSLIESVDSDGTIHWRLDALMHGVLAPCGCSDVVIE